MIARRYGESNKMKDCRLNEEVLLDKNHLPVLMILNAINEGRFLGVLEAISKGIGFGVESGACTFPDDLDEFDKANEVELSGIEFGLYSGEEVVIDYQTLYYYLKNLCDKYIEKKLLHTDIVKGFLADYTNKFLSRKERKNSN